MFYSCRKYDDSKIRQDIRDLQEQVASKDSVIRFASYEKQTVKNGDRIELILAPSVTKDFYAGIQADVVSDYGTVTSIVTKADAGNPWRIEVQNPAFGGDGKVTGNPIVVILNAGEYQTDAFLRVCLIDCEGQSHVATKAIAAGERPVADLVVYGKIYTVDAAESVADAFAVKDGKYIYVGSKDGAAEYAGPATEVVDYTGQGLVIPGCTEGHGHFVGIDGIVHQLPGFRASYEELIKTIDPQAMASKPGPFFSFGWNTTEIQKFSSRDYAMEIEAVSSGYPVVLDDGGGHNAVCNRTALKKAGIINDKVGLLTVNMMGYFTIRSYDWGMPKGGDIPESVKAKIDYVNYLDKVFTGGHINAGGIKLFQDGVTDTATGWISEEYTQKGLPDDRKHGNIIWKQEELDQIVAAANAKGFPVHTHTFGDLACHALVDAYVASPSASSLRIHNSLAHVRNISGDDIARCGANHIDIASNMVWHTGLPDWGIEYMLSFIPRNIHDSGYPMKSLLDAGVTVSSSTDAPCGEDLIGTVPNIIGASVTGLSPAYPDAAPFNPSELLTVREVLQCLTINGARSLGLEEERGSIEKGKYADFVLLDKDVFELEKTDKMEIFGTSVAGTWFEGRNVYQK